MSDDLPSPVRRLGARDLGRLAIVGLGARPLRALLSALGIAIGVASIVAVLGLSASSAAGLNAQIEALGTNLLTVTAGTDVTGATQGLPERSTAMVRRIGPVFAAEATGTVSGHVYRTPLIPANRGGGLTIAAATLDLPRAAGTSVAVGRYLNAATATEPVCVLGANAAEQLGMARLHRGVRIWTGGLWCSVTGILEPAPLAPEIDSQVLIGFRAAERYLGFDGHPSKLYVRAHTDQVEAVDGVLAATVNPQNPEAVTLSRPSAALQAQAAAQSAFDGLFLALGCVALLVGAIGVANIMVISVLERRNEIGLRRALGATRRHIRTQFLVEAMLLGLLGGVAGTALGAGAVAIYAALQDWAVVIPPVAWAGGLAASLLIGGASGLWPAVRASRLSPTEALWSV